MLVRRGSYPQVDPRAAGLMTTAIAAVPADLAVEAAARLGRRRRARLLVARIGGGWAAVTPGTLEQALGLGLHRVGLRAILWGMSRVEPTTPEVVVRRKLGPASPFVLVAGPTGPAGVVFANGSSGRSLPLSAAERLARLPEPLRRLLRSAGALGDELGFPVVAVGGLVRDLLLDGVPLTRADVDLAVEGDGRALARRLARQLGGSVREHAAFLTAMVELPGGQRIDVATARRERYPTPGALPQVEPAPVAADLGRRDFSVNALALRLNGAGWGEVIDPTGGLADLRRRRLRVLHPLSFVEDPTRMFRAIRFAVRLGFRLNPTTARLLRSAAALSVYRTLSADRLRAELDAVLAESAPAAVLSRLGREGVFRLLLDTYRFPERAAARLRAVAERAAHLPVATATRGALWVLALTAHLGPAATRRWIDRLGLPATMRSVIERARREAPALLAGLGRAGTRGEAYLALRGIPEAVAAWALVVARPTATRRHITDHLERWRHTRPLLTGDDLKGLGLTPGPLFGDLLDALRLEQVAGHVRRRAEAIAWVRVAVARRGREPRRLSLRTPHPTG